MGIDGVRLETVAVPEPSGIAALGLMLLCAGLGRYRRANMERVL